MYEPTLEALNGVLSLNMAHAAYVLTFCAGAAFGLGSFAKLLDWLLHHRHDMTMAALLGLIAGALRALWPYLTPDKSMRLPNAGEPVLPVFALGMLGLVAVLGLIWWSHQGKESVREA
jgi:putative membrane protein